MQQLTWGCKLTGRLAQLNSMAMTIDKVLWTGECDELGREKLEAKKEELITKIEQIRYILRKRYASVTH
jgi:hypothetical protein